MTAYRQTRYPVVLCDRIAGIRDQMTAEIQARQGHGDADLADALQAILDWWDATADMRALGIRGEALRELIEEASR